MSVYLKLLRFKKLVPVPVKHAAKQSLLWLRSFQKGRVYPDFIIIGVQKGGTTSLFTYIMQHPQVIPALHKQSFYFDRNFKKPLSYYRASFPKKSDLENRSKELNKKTVTGEATPDYIFDVNVPKRLQAAPFQPQLILIYRDPIQRCISEYNYLPEYYNNGQSIDDYFQDEINAYHSLDTAGLSYEELYAMKDKFPIILRSLFDVQLEHWLKFFPKENFLFMSNSALKKKPLESLEKVSNFLQVDAPTHVDSKKYNTTKRKKEKPSAEIISQLREILDPHFERFQNLIQ